LKYIFFVEKCAVFSVVGMKAPYDEGGGRILLGDDKLRGGYAVSDRISSFWSLDFNWAPFEKYTVHQG
jgi:hypothetical protein